MLLKVAVSALVIAGINVLARDHPQWGGWVASLPIVSLLSIIWLASDGASTLDLNMFVTRVLFGLVPTACLLAIVAAVLAQGYSVSAALGCAALAWAVMTVIARATGILNA